MNPSEFLKFTRPLKEHQKKDLDRFADKNEMALLWEAGAMKTACAIAWCRWKYTVNKSLQKTLIVSPVATLYNWRDEFIMNSPNPVHASVLVPYYKSRRMRYKGSERAKLILESDKKIIIINPESLDIPEVVNALQLFNAKIVVIDESDSFKNHNSKRLKSLLKITDNATYRCIMTGTPILNSYLDIWAQWRILDKGATFGTNFFVYRETYFHDKNISWKSKPNYFPNYVPKPNVDAEISKKIAAKSSRILKKDCLDLPPLVFGKDYVELSPEQEKAYKQMENTLLAEVKAGVCAAPNALTKVLRLLQIVSGHLPVESDDTNEKVVTIFQKLPRAERLKYRLEELTPNHKVIVWCNFKTNYVLIRQVCSDINIQWAEITGETVNIQDEIEKFNTNEKVRVMIANPQAGGIGINLQVASYAIYFSRNFSLRQREQSIARCYRGGSDIHEKITVIDLVSKGTIDELVLDALARKENFADLVLDKLKSLL